MAGFLFQHNDDDNNDNEKIKYTSYIMQNNSNDSLSKTNPACLILQAKTSSGQDMF